MSGGLPPIYRSGTGNLQFSTDYFDYFTGAGYKTFSLGGSEVSGASVFYLTTGTYASGVDTRSITASTATASQAFLLTFNNPAIIAGADAIAEFTTNVSAAMTTHANIEIFKVDKAGVGTSIGKEFLAARVNGASQYIRESLVIPLTKTHIGIGEDLKVVVELFSSGNSGNIYFDPKNRQTFTEGGSGATIGSDFNISIPFKIDL